jgi:hypothetical protein
VPTSTLLAPPPVTPPRLLAGVGVDLEARPGGRPPLLVTDSVRVGDGVRRLLRSDGTLQLGLRPEHAVMVRRPRSTAPPRVREDPPRAADPRTRAESAALALRLGSTGARTAVRQRVAARVDVLGDADLADPLAAVLRAAGVGHVRRAATSSPPGGTSPVALVIRCVLGVLTPESVEDLVRLGVPHLVVCVVEGAGTIGPLVFPGRTACLRCHQRRLADADPEWPVLAIQAAVQGPAVEACSAVTAAHVVAVAADVALRCVDGESLHPSGWDPPPLGSRPAPRAAGPATGSGASSSDRPDEDDADAATLLWHVGEPLDPVRVERVPSDARCGCVRR